MTWKVHQTKILDIQHRIEPYANQTLIECACIQNMWQSWLKQCIQRLLFRRAGGADPQFGRKCMAHICGAFIYCDADLAKPMTYIWDHAQSPRAAPFGETQHLGNFAFPLSLGHPKRGCSACMFRNFTFDHEKFEQRQNAPQAHVS